MAQLMTVLEGIVSAVERTVDAGSAASIAHRVREILFGNLAQVSRALPDSARAHPGDRYARRLLHRDPAGRFSVVVMAWGPGQATALHDHDGSWCVEGVVEGSTFSDPYRIEGKAGERYRFSAGSRIVATAGDTGAVFPPFEHHVYGNASSTTPALTLHVYGPELLRCHVYEPRPDGFWTRVERVLGYDSW